MGSNQDTIRRKVTPDRGFAWVVLVASFGCNYLTGVLVFSVGILHVELLHEFHGDVTTTAWAGSLFSGLMMFAAPLGSALVYAHSCRISVMAGSVFLCVGFVASAFATSVLQLIFTYGLIAGLGLGLTYTPSVMVITFYFDKYRGVATGLSVSGFALGILTGSLMIQAFIDRHGLSGAFLVIAGLGLQISVFAMLFFPTEHDGRGRRKGQNCRGSSQDKGAVAWKSSCEEQGFLTEDLKDCFNQEMYVTVGEDNETNAIVEENCPDSVAKVSLVDSEKERPDSFLVCAKGSDEDEGKYVSVLLNQKENVHLENSEKAACSKDKDEDNPPRSSPSSFATHQRIIQSIRGMCPLLNNWPFIFHCCCVFFTGMNLNGVYLHLPEYARVHGTSTTQAATLSVGVGIFSFLSRIGSGILVTSFKVNSIALNAGMLGMCSLSSCLFPLFSGTYVGQMIFASLYGLSNGGFCMLYLIVPVELVEFQALPAAYGMMIFITGAGYMAGPPVAGMIVDCGGTYAHSFVVLGLGIFLAAAFELCAKISHKRHTRRQQDI